MKKIEFEFYIISPLHIGSGEMATSIEYLQDKDYIFFVKPDKLFNFFANSPKMSKDKEKARKIFITYFRGAHSDASLDDFLKQQQLDISKFLEDENNWYRKIPKDNSVTGAKEINLAIKNGIKQQPYIPGSSIKGFFRNALLYNYLDTNVAVRNKFFNDIDRVYADPGKRRSSKQALEKIGEKYDGELFCYESDGGNGRKTFYNPQKSIMRFFQLPDINFSEFSTSVLQANSYNQKGREQIPIVSEYITNLAVNDRFSFTLSIDDLQLKKNKLFEKPLQKLFGNIENIGNQLENSITTFTKKLISEEIDFCERMNVHTIKNFKDKIKDKHVFYMPIGKQTGFFSKTISFLLKKYEKYELLEKIAEISFPNAYPDNFPATKNLVYYNNKLYLPGWLFVQRKV